MQIDWDNRFIGTEGSHNQCLVTVDGTDCRIFEPRPFDRIWYSHKFRGPGLRYEIAVSIAKGRIVWINGPFPCGAWPDAKIFNTGLVELLSEGEMVVADRGYKGAAGAQTPLRDNSITDKLQAECRARHETVNARLKQFRILSHVFRHNKIKHHDVFFACANLTELMLCNGNPLFQIQYDEEAIQYYESF